MTDAYPSGPDRRAFLAMAERRGARGSGSRPALARERSSHYGTPDLASWLGDLPYLVVGGLATRLYMAERMTLDADVLVAAERQAEAEERLRSRGARQAGLLAIGGSSWDLPGAGPLDLIAVDAPWVADAIARPVSGPGGLPYVSLPYLVLMKLGAGRVQDLADITRMLGGATDVMLTEVLDLVRRHRPDDLDDVKSMARMGRRELG